MPTIVVDKYELYKALGQKFSKQEFEDLCFDFGIELDEASPRHIPPHGLHLATHSKTSFYADD